MDAGRAASAALFFVSVLVSAAAWNNQAEASPRICRQLESQLAGLSARSPTGDTRRYDRAIEAQQIQIDRAMRQMRRTGCDGGFSIFGRSSGGSSCAAISDAVVRMERNLLALQRTRSRMGNGLDPRRERARLMASIEANGCRETTARGRSLPGAVARDGRPALFDQLFGGDLSRRQTLDEYDRTDHVRTVPQDGYGRDDYGGGSYRTLCVRTCDGYYFPISHASSRRDFDRDQQNCETMCPGTEVKLFSHRVPDEESESMVALDGTPYVDLPSAFKYRDVNFSRPATCGCNPAKNFTIIGGGTADAAAPAIESEALHAPVARPDPAADPETLANRDGGFDGETIQRLLAPRPADTGSTDKRVRVVGPAYLPDPEAALDLQAPAPTSLQ